MNVYLSARSDSISAAQAAMAKIRAAGHEITYDWTEHIRDEARASEEQLSKRAKADIRGVAAADVVVVLLPGIPRVGVPIEMGAAFVLGIPVFVVEGEGTFSHFFANHPCFQSFAGLKEAIREIDTVKDQPEHLALLDLLGENRIETKAELEDMLKLHRALENRGIDSLEALDNDLDDPHRDLGNLVGAVRDFLDGPLSQHAAVFRAHYQALQRALEKL